MTLPTKTSYVRTWINNEPRDIGGKASILRNGASNVISSRTIFTTTKGYTRTERKSQHSLSPNARLSFLSLR